MHFIIFDLEFNQEFSSLQHSDKNISQYPFEIIQIGALKLDEEFNTIATFNRYVKPTIYTKISPFITELTGITTERLLTEALFPEIYKAYEAFIGGNESVFCIWGKSDIKELFKNAEYHQLSTRLLPRLFINVQPYVSKYLSISQKKLLRLQHAVELLNIPMTYAFHNALYDAYYTAEIFKRIYSISGQPVFYDPSYVAVKLRQRQPKRTIDTDKLLQQFEKMYARNMTEEEQEIIKLAYKMGKTNQFLK
ncbi:3'-5' exonuclease [Cellulosilyticum sp. I15G10I2]|uniref:3'-5' exonuclease n=1 Tax=Cellulosilyticum sp. I15G10I2 TaxID=1892843 RepID=UPI00085CA760|nr:3'-5' exonuclease [Cellulosilyticum sp. I15G10I2]